jgi:transposase-like protein
MRIVRRLPLAKQEAVLRQLESAIMGNSRTLSSCSHCNMPKDFVKFGYKNNKQRYKCKACNKIFTERTGTALSYSWASDEEWTQVILDTINGVSLRATARTLNTNHQRIFRMRHAIIGVIEAHIEDSNGQLEGIVEVDDTYFLMSVKGSQIDETRYYRKSRRHGAKIRIRGVSNERVSVNVGVERKGDAYSRSVNTGKPSTKDVLQVFENRVAADAVVYCDGDHSLIAAFDKIANVERVDRFGKYHHINRVNQFHSQLKNRIDDTYHGVATKYLNRYCAMMSLRFGRSKEVDEIVDYISELMFRPAHNRVKYFEMPNHNILDLGQLANL